MSTDPGERSEASDDAEPPVPTVLCTDLDGTLVATDLLYESFASVLREAPLSLVALPAWLLDGRPRLKRELAARAKVDARRLPFRDEVVAYLAEAKQQGRRVVLATASHQDLADAVATAVGVFDDVIGTSDGPNLKGARKKEVLDTRYGVGGYEYIGDSDADLAVWDGAAAASCVGWPDARLAEVRAPVVRRFDGQPAGGAAWFGSVGPGAVAWNALAVMPLAILGAVPAPFSFAAVLLGVVAVSSAVALLERLVDLPDARAAEPMREALAAGRLPLVSAIAAVPVLAIVGAAVALVGGGGLPALAVIGVGACGAVAAIGGAKAPWLRRAGGLVAHALRILAGAALV